MRVFSNLNLNGSSPTRAQPRVGEWGPEKVPSVRFKKWQRVLVPIAAVVIAVAVTLLAYFFFKSLFPDQPEGLAPIVVGATLVPEAAVAS